MPARRSRPRSGRCSASRGSAPAAVPGLALPGCARSPKVSGFDWVLQRLLAALPVGPAEIRRMGVGGLLTEIPTRGLPRELAEAAAADDDERPAVHGPRLAGLV